jgi:hypothetical protein
MVYFMPVQRVPSVTLRRLAIPKEAAVAHLAGSSQDSATASKAKVFKAVQLHLELSFSNADNFLRHIMIVIVQVLDPDPELTLASFICSYKKEISPNFQINSKFL